MAESGFNRFIGAAAPVLLLTLGAYASRFLDTASRLPGLYRLERWLLGGSSALLVLDVGVVQSGQHETVAAQNRELLEASSFLALQTDAIAKLNLVLSRDLHAEKAARIEAREVDFGEFSQMHPDKDACLRYLADLKWAQHPYRCRKCGHEKSCVAREPFAHRCTRCRYVESATTGALLQKCKFSIVKALYAVFLLHAHRGDSRQPSWPGYWHCARPPQLGLCPESAGRAATPPPGSRLRARQALGPRAARCHD